MQNSTAMLTLQRGRHEANNESSTQAQGKFKEAHGVNLGFMSFFTKAVCHALQQFPAVNAYIDPEKSQSPITITVISR